MGCNCKKAKKIRQILGVDEAENTNKKFFKFSLTNSKNYLARTFQGLLVFGLTLVIIPIVLLYLMFSFIFNGSTSLKIPNFLANKM